MFPHHVLSFLHAYPGNEKHMECEESQGHTPTDEDLYRFSYSCWCSCFYDKRDTSVLSACLVRRPPVRTVIGYQTSLTPESRCRTEGESDEEKVTF